MKFIYLFSSVLGLLAISAGAFAEESTLSLSLSDAESRALSASDLLKSYVSDQRATVSQADAQFQNLLPKLSLSASYTYYNTIPLVSLVGGPPIPFGTNSIYNFGPVLNYTLWDTFASRNSYRATSALADARDADRENAALQILYNIRATYVQVQLGLEELGLIHDSLELARAQDRDVSNRLQAGAATRVDKVTSERSVLSYQIQFKQRQSELAASVRDLMTLLKDETPRDISRPGPTGVPNLSLALKLESLDRMLAEESESGLTLPGDSQPQIRSQELQAKSFELQAKSAGSQSLPTVQLSGGVSYNRPDIPNPPSYWQEYGAVSLTMPLFFGDSSRDVAASQRSQAEAASYRASQIRDNLHRDFDKAEELLRNLKEQQQLAVEDVRQSQEEARLYYTAYKAGKLNLIDVQNANNQALQAKVNLARIDAQILDQIITLKSISGEGHPL
jgi:outer membrane protein TolC